MISCISPGPKSLFLGDHCNALEKQLWQTWVNEYRTNASSALLSIDRESKFARKEHWKWLKENQNKDMQTGQGCFVGEHCEIGREVSYMLPWYGVRHSVWPSTSQFTSSHNCLFCNNPPAIHSQRQCNNLSFQLSVTHSSLEPFRGRTWFLSPFLFIYLSWMAKVGVVWTLEKWPLCLGFTSTPSSAHRLSIFNAPDFMP